MKTNVDDKLDSNGKFNHPDFFTTTRIFKGDGNEDNSDAIRILRQHENGFYLVIKIFNFSEKNINKRFFTVKFHSGDINKIFRLEESWNMNEQLQMSFSERLSYVEVFNECLLSWRRHSSSLRHSFLMSDLYNTLNPDFVTKYCKMFGDGKGKFRFIVTIRSKVSLVIKFSNIHEDRIFTAKYRFEKVENFAKYYNMEQYSNIYKKQDNEKQSNKQTLRNKNMTGYSPAYVNYFVLKDILSKIFMKINNFNNDIIGFEDNNKYQIIRRK